MTRRQVRGALALPVLGVVGAVLLWGLSGLPPFGHFHGFYGHLLNHIALPQRHTTNVVTAIVFDYRGFDTMGEEFILFAAVTGVVLLLRGDDEDEEHGVDVRSEALRVLGVTAAGIVVLVGLWLAAFGLVTPGGGFQGGVVIASGLALVYLTVGYHAWKRLANEKLVDPLEGLGAGA
jgi:multicomponent Na+:H+ antiporter subunit B